MASLARRRLYRQEIHTAGSSSQVSDGAAVVILASAAGVEKYGLKPRAKIRATTLVGCDPHDVEGADPCNNKVLDQTGLSIDDIDVFEVNEAFASVVLAWQKAVGADAGCELNGGAIALGHPTGSTGARLITTALHELERTNGRRPDRHVLWRSRYGYRYRAALARTTFRVLGLSV